MIYLLLALWIGYAVLEGKREANFWHHRVASRDYDYFKHIDRHPMFALQRGMVLLMMSIASYYIWDSIWLVGYGFIMNCLVFSFFHNGMMYLERFKMSKIAYPKVEEEEKWVYTKGWWDQSTTSTALTTRLMTPISRTIQAILGIIGYACIPLF